jgi:hypothetical protein
MHEREYDHAHATPEATTHDSELAPGHSNRAAQLVAPTRPLISGLLQRKARDGNGVAGGAEHAVASASSSSGEPLPEPIMRKFESSLGADLSGVRVHTGSESQAAADAIGAAAYTVGQHIHFNAGRFDPSSSSGQWLLAHEVAHTVQQQGSVQTVQHKLEISQPGDAAEIEADRAADAMMAGSAAMITTIGAAIHRKPDGEARTGRTQVTPGDSNQSKQVTAKQQATLKKLQGQMNSLSGKAQTVSSALSTALATATSQFEAIDAGVNSLAAKYTTAYGKHRTALQTAGAAVARDEAIIKAVLGMAIAPAIGMVMPALGYAASLEKELLTMSGQYALAAEAAALKTIPASIVQAAERSQRAAAAAVGKQGLDAGGSHTGKAGDPASTNPAVKQLEQVQQISKLKTKLLGAANKVVDVGPLDTAVETTLRDLVLYAEKGSGTSVADPVDVVIKKASGLVAHAPAAYAAAGRATAAAGKGVAQLAAAIAAADAGQTASSMENKIWVEWIASSGGNKEKKKLLDKLNGGLLSRALIPQQVIDMLGVDVGSIMNDGDLNQQIMNAKLLQEAQQLVGKTGTYTGPLNPHSQGTVIVDSTTYTAEFSGFVQASRNDSEVGTQDIKVVDARVFPLHAAETGTGMNKARQRFGLFVRPLERNVDPAAPTPALP